MTVKPISFSGPMVRAILGGRKTQTRRPVKPQPFWNRRKDVWEWPKPWEIRSKDSGALAAMMVSEYPYGQPGDRLWVKETFMVGGPEGNPEGCELDISYAKTLKDSTGKIRLVSYIANEPMRDSLKKLSFKMTPSIHMPRWASRITLEITGVRVERVQEVSYRDAFSEGASGGIQGQCGMIAREEFQASWDEIYAAKGFGWDKNPWVWVIDFKNIYESPNLLKKEG